MSAKRVQVEKRVIEKSEIPLSVGETSKQWIEKHQVKLIGIAVGLFAVTAAVWGFNAHGASRERRAQADYARIVQNWPDKEGSPPQALEVVAADLEKLVKDYESTSASRNAELDLAKAYYQMGRLGEALKWNSQILDQVVSDQHLKLLAHYQLALTCEALGKVDEALKEWQLLQGEGIKGISREVQWRMAKSYFRKGDYPRAIEHFEKAIQSEGNYPAEPFLQSELAHTRSVSGLHVEAQKDGLQEAGK